jgi:hypothetical protein
VSVFNGGACLGKLIITFTGILSLIMPVSKYYETPQKNEEVTSTWVSAEGYASAYSSYSGV